MTKTLIIFLINSFVVSFVHTWVVCDAWIIAPNFLTLSGAQVASVRIPRFNDALDAMFAIIWHLKKSPFATYRQLLEEQRDLLERQLRQTREELLLLRHQLQLVHRNKGSANLFKIEQKKRLEREIAFLQDEVRKLTELRQDLERLLQDEQSKVIILQSKVNNLKDVAVAKKEQHDRELKLLRRDMEEQVSRQLAAFRALMENRMKEELEKIRIAAEKDRHVALLTAAKEKEKAIRETERRVVLQADKLLLDEKKSAQESIEREKNKMRKLIKALAEREKKLLSHAENEKQIKVAKTSAKPHSKTSSQKANLGTVRGSFK